MNGEPTRYKLNCPTCGERFLTLDEYNQQMCLGDTQWTCPTCGYEDSMMWDDEWNKAFEAAQLKALEIATRQELKLTLVTIAACVAFGTLVGLVLLLLVGATP